VNSGAVPRLYISGVNGGAGLRPDRFVAQFSARNPTVRDMRQLVECCVEWGELAENTFQNALETKCWIDRRRLSGPLLLITSQGHMARALAALSGALPGRTLIPYPVPSARPPVDPIRPRVFEYLRYLATIITVRLPRIISAQRFDGPFLEGCPGRP
jgi:uncharacterized SAM-binding protein YcdF (DUF218 family)